MKRKPGLLGARRRISILDVATGIILLLAGFVLVGPGGALRGTVERWQTTRQATAAVRGQWGALSAAAIPLYAAPAPPDIIEFSDYQCPFCRAAEPAIDSAIARGLRVAIIHLPLRIHALARPAALAATCATMDGQFARVHQFLMSDEDWAAGTSAGVFAAIRATAPTAIPENCEQDSLARQTIERHVSLAKAIGVTGTPMFVSKGGLMADPPTMENLLRFAEKE
jgi:protein-disulfide isomerase